MSKNKIAEREVEKSTVVEIKIDEKEKQPVKKMTKAEGKEIIKKYKERCEKFPARMEKFKRKEPELKKWLDSLPEN